MKKTLIDSIIRDKNKVVRTSENRIIDYSYRRFLTFFKKRKALKLEDVIIGAFFSYGWMPTMLKHLDIRRVGKVVRILNRAKTGRELKVKDFETLKSCINNSIVGGSKLLHFVNPKQYAIWDSRVLRYLKAKDPEFKKKRIAVNSAKNYELYLQRMKRLTADRRSKNVTKFMTRKIGYSVTPLRAFEYVMFDRAPKKRRGTK